MDKNQEDDECVSEPSCPCPDDPCEKEHEVKELPSSQFEGEGNIGVLSEDHPLLQKFQQSLKAHLVKVQAQLMREIQDINFDIKDKEKQREDIGEKLYDMQQEICRQNTMLEEYAQQIKETNEKRVISEKGVLIIKKEYEDKLALSKEAKRLHNERLLELNNLQMLENNIEKWAKEVEDEVTNAKKVVGKDAKTQEAVAAEKKKIDLIIFNMDSEARKRQHELDQINAQLKEEEDILNALRTNISDANADLEVLQQEQRRLTQAWSQVIIAVQQRDKVLFQAKNKLRLEEERYKHLLADIEGSKKEAAREMEKNENLEMFKKRISDDIKNLKRQLDKENDIIRKINEKLLEVQSLIQEAENDFQLAKQEGNSLDIQIRSLCLKFNKEAAKKSKVEEEILQLMQEQVTADKATEYRMKVLHGTREQRRKLEVSLSGAEYSLSSTLLDVEKWKGIIIQTKEENEVNSKKLKEIEDQIEQVLSEVRKTEHSTKMKMKQFSTLSKKLGEILTKTGGEEISVIDFKIKGLEKHIQELEAEIRRMQIFWITLQGHVVNMSEKRAAQLNELQTTRKQIMVIQQKTIKVNKDLQAAIDQGRELSRNITNLNYKFDALNAKLFEKKMNHRADEEECQFIHFEQMDKLKDAEMNALLLEQEIVDLTREIEQMKEEVLERHREVLSWESKYKLVEDIVRWRRNETSGESEINAMKTEIRRMEVRYGQLKRAQEKLVKDLEFCVMHRENIFVAAMTRQKLEGTQSRSRSTIQHKLNEMKNKIKIINNEIGTAEKTLADLNSKYDGLVQEICKKQNDIDNEKLQDELIQAEIEEGLLMKHKNLENIVRKQHRGKKYRCLAAFKVSPKTKPETAILRDLFKQMEINENLIDITQHLLNEFPEKKYYIMRIMQTLRDD